ncbi:4Fe-4S cluster-binding domain-containing protein [Helicobacter pullorum]|uniref:4Fe-4S cluster-binding domain-containing protein n=1 Tax=Helicobacter pullorum TaxID=35818 RepID=UPI001E295F83|nr:4Fe-4S cluster-binding domain-containing protein [Helicobacter pullorum]
MWHNKTLLISVGGGHLLAPNEQYKKALQDAEDEILKLKQSLEILKQDSKEDLREIQTLQNTLQIAESRILELTKQNADLKNANDILQKSNEQAISYLQKLTPQPFLKLIEIHLAESCNLNCFSCSHFSQLAPNEMPDIQSYEKEIKRLSEITNGLVGRFHLMGGEPLLNPNCKDFFAITRKYFPNSAIWLVTNGILLPKQETSFWESCKNNRIEIRPTKYPIKVDWDLIKAKCESYGIPLKFFNNENVVKTSMKFILEPKGNIDAYNSFINCGMANNCVQLRDGKLYPCNIAANIEFFNQKFNQNLQVIDSDFIDIYKAKDYTEILQFLAKPIPFCRYCNVAKWRSIGEWKTSKKEIGEYLE